ncbi:methyl-accepting chemotaxis protein [Bdellovibrio bacteriovorus]|uniref:Chemotaxis protein n=1 Tax=Bdellovibrio bacteriovorus str. Tiberius TaxID=1069642 RepID=K7Z1D8_BDEBC|nr:methyl-accepting chemotaxis protein [Bdellovibrio bacteriovorus]AFY02855.1 chemotaxis protein [Bdellovibrio bacteriovorus str. Tiberius]
MNLKAQFKGLRGKLLGVAVLPLIALSVTAWISFQGFSQIGTMLNESYAVYVPNIRLLGQLNLNRANIGYFTFAALANKDDMKGRENFVGLLDRSVESYTAAMAEYEKQNFIEGEAEAFRAMKDNYPKYLEYTKQVREALLRGTPADFEFVVSLVDKGGPWQVLQIQIDHTITKIYEMYTAISKSNNELQKKERSQKASLIVGVALGSSLVLFLIMLWIANRVSGSVGRVVGALTEISQNVSGAISQLSVAGQALSTSSTEAAASLEETVASLEEMTSMVSRNSDSAKQASSLADGSSSVAKEGELEINSLIESMSQISRDSKKIEEIIHVIDDIAFQTNLLALNAAVEAARAGEQGKGFAVVAEAVRALAQRSATAAKEINGLIKESVERTEKGSVVADNSGQVLTRIVSSVEQVVVLNREIAQASSEQSQGISQISKAMNQLDQASQSNAASSEEIAATAGEIERRAHELQQQVQILSSEVLGAS